MTGDQASIDEHAIQRMDERGVSEEQVIATLNHPDLKISVDETTGTIRAAYLRVREGAVHQTREVAEGRAFAEYRQDRRAAGH